MKNLIRVALISAFVATAAIAAATAHPASAAVLAALPANAALPSMQLVSTDAGEAYPFAAIEVDQNLLHVTVGDKLYGVTVVRITANEVTLSDGRILHLAPAVATIRR
jgi:hypothetical protein